jgi:hypothetical protein
MPNNLIITTEVPVTAEHLDKAAATWQQHLKDHAQTGHQLYRNLQADTLLELTAVTDDLAELATLRQSWIDLWPQLSDYLTGDYRRQLLHHVESPKPSTGSLPAGKYLQLRHIEVAPAVYQDYRAWREETIFDVVRNSPVVKSFDAYHSVFSTEPGVMFVSSFDTTPQEYQAVFNSPRYQQIVQQAGDRFIVGGDRGLYTTTYQRLTA